MNFADALAERGYAPNHDGVFTRPDYGGIAYSDGDAVEERIAAIVWEAGDISCFSSELAMRCTDWPSRYHLSANRGNILRPFRALLKGAEVLEIGCGCGAITRLLGESGAAVLALDGSPRRAAIARSRTRDLANVTVLAERFDRFEWAGRFDVVTLIGVLEYAAMFNEGDDPAVAMLARARKLLKPGGRLMLAIENRFGLKYFAGAPEDHVGRAMYGIEGRYEAKGPRTWGRKELREMLERAGFARQNWLVPFPDYKLPVSIVTEAGLNSPDFDSAAFAWQSARRDPQLPQYLHFAPELAWPGLVAGGLALDLANSFLVVASVDDAATDAVALAYHYSVNDRRSAFCKETVFQRRANGAIGLAYYPLGPDGAYEAEGDRVRFHIPREAEYLRGETLAARFVRIITRDDWRPEELAHFLLKYLDAIQFLLQRENRELRLDSLSVMLPGRYYDCIPQNIIENGEGTVHVIDREWTLREDMPLGLLLFRAMINLLPMIGHAGAQETYQERTCLEFFTEVFAASGMAVGKEELDAWAFQESRIIAEIIGYTDDPANIASKIWQPFEKLRNSIYPCPELAGYAPFARDGSEPAENARLRALLDKSRSDHLLACRRLVSRCRPFRHIGAVAWPDSSHEPPRDGAGRAGRLRGKLLALADRCDRERRRQLQLLRNLLERAPLFDRAFYLDKDPELRRAGIDPIQHYFFHGAAEGRNPGPYFFTAWYLAEYPDVAASGMNPLLHFLQYGVQEGRNPNPYFLTSWYRREYLAERGDVHPLAHYLHQGWRAGAWPNPLFDGPWYADAYFVGPDREELEPLLHFLGLDPDDTRYNPNPCFDGAWYLRSYPWTRAMGMHPLQHYLRHGLSEQTEPNPYFDSGWYMRRHPEAREAGLPPLAHYLVHVREGGVSPNPFFDADWYRRHYADVRENNLDPFLHYILHGAGEYRDPGPHFNTYWYMRRYPDVAASGMNPLLHYITIGRHENRRPHPDLDGEAPDGG